MCGLGILSPLPILNLPPSPSRHSGDKLPYRNGLERSHMYKYGFHCEQFDVVHKNVKHRAHAIGEFSKFEVKSKQSYLIAKVYGAI